MKQYIVITLAFLATTEYAIGKQEWNGGTRQLMKVAEVVIKKER